MESRALYILVRWSITEYHSLPLLTLILIVFGLLPPFFCPASPLPPSLSHLVQSPEGF